MNYRYNKRGNMLNVNSEKNALNFLNKKIKLSNWKLAVEVNGTLLVSSTEQTKFQNISATGFSVVFSKENLVLDCKTEHDSDAGTIRMISTLENRSAKSVLIQRIFIMDCDQIEGFCSAQDEVVALSLDGAISKRSVHDIRNPEPAKVWTNPLYPVRSKIKTQFYNRTKKLALQVGFVSFQTANTEVEYEYSEQKGIARLQAWCDYGGFELKPDAKMPVETFLVSIGTNPHIQLENWAMEAAKAIQVRQWHDAPIGWLGWSWVDPFTVERYEDIVLRNAKAIRKRLAGFDVNYIWISIGNLADGNPGDWLNWNKKSFPSGPEFLNTSLKNQGFTWGLWCGPFWLCALCREKITEYQDALLKNSDGSLYVVRPEWQFGVAGEMPKEKRPVMYALDPSHPKSLAYMRDVFTTYKKWGVRYYMADFMEAGAGNTSRFPYADHFDKALVAGAQVYHNFLKMMRAAAGDDTYFLGSSGPTIHNAGFVDGQRTGNDFGEGRAMYPDSYFYPATFVINSGAFWTGPQLALQNQAAHYYTHRKLYINDSGNVLTVDKPLPLNDARIHTTIHAMSGGPTMIGDDVDRMDEERLTLIRQTLPRPKEVAFPVDLFDSPSPKIPKIFQRKIEKPWGRFDVVAVYNFEKEMLREKIEFARLGLKPDVQYLVWEFWNTEYQGGFQNCFETAVAPGCVNIYRFVEDTGRPMLLATDMHLLMGEMDIEQCVWDEKDRTLRGLAKRPIGQKGSVFFHVPKELRVANPAGKWIAKDARDDSLIVRCVLDFVEGTADWEIRFAGREEQRTMNELDLT